jgi:Zn-dependent protease
MLTGPWLLRGLMFLVPLVLSLSVHEWAHAYTAYRLGDDTAERQGRMTLNPIVHIDPIGTILLPLLGIPFGWAKPVPINPLRFRRDVSMRAGIMITAAAGPISNLLLAVVLSVAYGLLLRFGVIAGYGDGAAGSLLTKAIVLNLALCLFNFIPVPPLDGSRVADGLVPYRYRHLWDQFTRYSWLALLLVIVVGGSLLTVPLSWIYGHLQALIWALAGR